MRKFPENVTKKQNFSIRWFSVELLCAQILKMRPDYNISLVLINFIIFVLCSGREWMPIAHAQSWEQIHSGRSFYPNNSNITFNTLCIVPLFCSLFSLNRSLARSLRPCVRHKDYKLWRISASLHLLSA